MIKNHTYSNIRSTAKASAEIFFKNFELQLSQFALVNFWEVNNKKNTWLYKFLQRSSLKNLTNSQKVAIFSIFGNVNNHKFIRSDIKIFFSGENVMFWPAYKNHGIEWTDLSMGFDEFEDNNYLRFPLWILFSFPPDANLASIKKTIDQLNNADPDFVNRKKFASLVASYDRDNMRASIGDLVEKVGKVSYPGAFRRNTPNQLPPGWPAKIAHLKEHKFNICPENSDRTGYVTEKIFHAIEAGCIPVYWGADNYPEPGLLNQERIIFYNPDAPQELAERLSFLSNNEKPLQEFASQPAFLPGSPEIIYGYYQRLEEKLLEILARR